MGVAVGVCGGVPGLELGSEVAGVANGVVEVDVMIWGDASWLRPLYRTLR